MEQTIKIYEKATLVNVEKSERCVRPDWNWREEFLDKTGKLEVCKNTSNVRRQYYFYFDCEEFEDYLTSGYGEMVVDGCEITFTTRNSIYKFAVEFD